MIMCGLLCYPLSIHMSQLLSTGRPISSLNPFGRISVVEVALQFLYKCHFKISPTYTITHRHCIIWVKFVYFIYLFSFMLLLNE